MTISLFGARIRRLAWKAALIAAASFASAFGQQAAQSPQAGASATDIGQAWDDVIQNALPQAPVDPVLQQPQPPGAKASAANIANHFYFESHTDFERYQTYFTGQPTITGVIDAPITNISNTAGIPYPIAFQPDANRIYSFVDFGTRGYLSDHINTHFALRYDQDLTHVDIGSPAENINEVSQSNRRIELLNASLEFNSNLTGGSGVSFQIGRQNVYGAEIASFDGGSFTLNRPLFELTLYGGRRFSYFSDPDQREIGGGNLLLRTGKDTTVELETLWYIRGTNKIVVRHRIGARWQVSSYFRAYGGAPVDFDAQALYSPSNGHTTLRLGFFQKLSDNDYDYDYTVNARDLNPNDPLLRLNLGPIAKYAQYTIEAHHQINSSLRAGGSAIIRLLNNTETQGPYDTSFEDYKAGVQYFPLRKVETSFEYHQRNSNRLSPLGATTFDDVTDAGETSVKDVTGEIGRSFGEGRFYVSGGMYYRRISMQDRFYYIDNIHQSGALASAWFKIDHHSRLSFDYSLDNDFFLFMPDIKNSQMFRVGLAWRY
jgi:hypothetical protein